MKITEADMKSRQRMANLKMSLSEALSKHRHDGVTYAELLIVLSEMALRWAEYLRQEDMKEGDR